MIEKIGVCRDKDSLVYVLVYNYPRCYVVPVCAVLISVTEAFRFCKDCAGLDLIWMSLLQDPVTGV